MNEQEGRILFRLTESSLIVANSGRPFSLHGLIAVVYGWTSTKGRERLEWPEDDRNFVDEKDAQKVINERRDAKREHLQDPYELNSQSSQQSQTVQSYSGRTLFELLQNAVDANSEKPIGYKGVGFRSVLNITSSPEIHSGPLHAQWSPKIAEETVGAAAKNLPVLAFPRWSENRPGELEDFDTVVVLPLTSEKKAEIEEEWEGFVSDPSIVVFISGLSKVTWDRYGSVVSWERSKANNRVSIIQSKSDSPKEIFRWETFDFGVSKVAIPIGESGTLDRTGSDSPTTLRCFFPTEDANPFLNVLIHSEFPLTPDRKHIDVQHRDTEGAIKDVAAAVSRIAANRTNLDEALDVLGLRAIGPPDEETLAGKICAEVQNAISKQPLQALDGKALSSLRSCPRGFGQKHLSDVRRLELWEIFKVCVASHRQNGLEGLPFFPCGFENVERERTLIWLNSQAPLSLQGVQGLEWAKCEGLPKPCSSKVLFSPPRGDDDVPEIPDEIELKFLDRGLYADLLKKLEYSWSWFLTDVLGVEKFDLERVVTTAVFPVLEKGGSSELILDFLRDLYLGTVGEKNGEFDWTKPWKVRLSQICKVRCEGNEWHPAIEIYAGEQWTGTDFLERCYRERSDRSFLHAPDGDEAEVKQRAGFYRWLGVGWAPKVIPIVLEEKKREGWEWSSDGFKCPGEEPEDWKSYCMSAWEAQYRSEAFVHRHPRLKSDWSIDGGFSLLDIPGAFENIYERWNYFRLYAKSSCGWSGNQQENNDDKTKRSISYLFWRLKRIEWIPSSDGESKRQPLDCFKKGEVLSSRALSPLISRLPQSFPEKIANDLEIRSSFEEIDLEDWKRWIARIQHLNPTQNFEDRETIRRFYSCVLSNAEADQNQIPFHELNVWWVERLEDRENWILSPPSSGSGTYLDRPEFEKLRLPGLIVFPARLDEKAKKAESLFGISRLSDKLTGNPFYEDSWPLDAVADRIGSRAEFIISYLALNRGESGQAKLAKLLGGIQFLGTCHLSVGWHLDGKQLDLQETESFIHPSQGIWTLITTGARNLDERDPIWEKVAETLLLACGFTSTERSSNLRDILTYPKGRLKEKLTSLGVAPESIEDAKLASLDEPASVVLAPLSKKELLPKSDPPPLDPLPEKSIVPPTPENQVKDFLPRVGGGRPATSARPHPETGIPAQQKLCAQLVEMFGPSGWIIKSEVADEDISTRTDIVLEHPDSEPFFIEVKNLNARQIFWSERQIQMAETKGSRYCIALIVGASQSVQWILNPLETLKPLPKAVGWSWKTRSSSGEFDDSWRPKDSPPNGVANSFKAVVTILPGFLDVLPEGIEYLKTVLTCETGNSAPSGLNSAVGPK